MDGISSASAVVALTVQLISTTCDIVKFLKEIQDSPDELLDTIEVLQDLRHNLELVKRLVEEQSSCVDLPDSIASINDALQNCESKIKTVEHCVNKFKVVFDGGSQVRKKWASFKHVLKKGEIQRLQKQLESARNNLLLVLIINTNRLVIPKIRATAAPFELMLAMSNVQCSVGQESSTASSSGSQEQLLGSISALLEELKPKLCREVDVACANSISLDSVNRIQDMQRATTGPNEYSEVSTKTSASTEPSNSMSTNKDLAKPSPDSRRQYLVISKETMLFWYTGVLGNVSVQKKSKITNKALNVHVVHEGSVSEESIYIFRPSFVKNQYELRFVKRRGHVFRNLSIDCVVDFKAPVFNMCRAGNIKGLREAFESGSVSPNVVNPFGMTLLHYAAGSFQKDLCSWLLAEGVRADHTCANGSKALTYMGMKSRVGQSRAVTQTMIEIARLLSGVQEDLSEFDISMWFQEYEGPPEGAELILSHDLAHYYLRPTDDVDPLYPPLASILRLYAKDSRLWESVTRTLIRLGVDVHAPVRRDLSYLDQSEYVCPLPQYGTPLDELFMYTSDPSEGQAAANGWLQILESEGFDISVYLETESTLHVKPMQLTHPSFRPWSYDNERKLVFDVGAQPSVSWDWWISPSSSASLIREEFKLMAISDPDWLLIAQSWKEAWPVKFPVWSELHQSYGDKSSCLRYKKLLESAETRATNRLAKKAQKLARLHRHKGPRKVPGAWPI